MKVLMLHNKYKISGGEDVSTQAEYEMLKEGGLDIDLHCVHNDALDHMPSWKAALNTVWSISSHKDIVQRIHSKKYDLVHVQNFFPLLSPSIFHAAKKCGVKVVMSVRNYRLVCPNALLFTNDEVCEKCVGKSIPFPGITGKCYRDSRAASAVAVAMLSAHHLLGTFRNKVDGYICISEFVKKQLMEGGFAENKLHVKHNFVVSQLEPSFQPGEYYVYAGRLSQEKGIDLVMEAFRNTNLPLKIIGDGPLKESLKQQSASSPNISLLGKLPLQETYKVISGAKALVFPSKWHEPFGRTIVEAFAHGTPVVGTAMGGVTELIKDGYNGFLFDPFKNHALTDVLNRFEQQHSLKLREQAYQSYQSHFTKEKNFSELTHYYQQILTA
ncbi:MAG: glycosyltransferase family 4 protein [Cytophagaceae bacterium]|jgi:glycosyltransferase involved in cell wall biosynthesis|nr:glycosyltransferase family 4 protein [Cytophagaceae bacterium]